MCPVSIYIVTVNNEWVGTQSSGEATQPFSVCLSFPWKFSLKNGFFCLCFPWKYSLKKEFAPIGANSFFKEDFHGKERQNGNGCVASIGANSFL